MEDREIVELYWKRDMRAIEASNLKYGGYLRDFAGRFVNPQEVEACVAGTYLRAWNAMPPERPSALRAFLARLTRELAVERIRRDPAALRDGEVRAVIAELDAALESSHEGAADRELGDHINGFVRSLPARVGDVFVRRYFFAESPGEIAERYGMRTGAVASALARTRGRLGKYLRRENCRGGDLGGFSELDCWVVERSERGLGSRGAF